jgi:hypothetical protein
MVLVEFFQMMAAEALVESTNKKSKSIEPEHVVTALQVSVVGGFLWFFFSFLPTLSSNKNKNKNLPQTLGFPGLADECNKAAQSSKTQQKERLDLKKSKSVAERMKHGVCIAQTDCAC